jgi:hypothetical protein
LNLNFAALFTVVVMCFTAGCRHEFGVSVIMPHKLTLILLMVLSCNAIIVAQHSATEAHNQISDLLKSNQVSKISVIHVPSDLETRTSIDQQALRRLTRIEFSFTKPGEAGMIEPLQTALEELQSGKPSAVHDLRWGILFSML